MDIIPYLSGVPEVQKALRHGEREQAYKISIQLTRNEPKNDQAWLGLACSTESSREKITALGHVITLNPTNKVASQLLYESLLLKLKEDPFLAYEGETENFYKILDRAKFHFLHPKNRKAAPPYPPATHSKKHSPQFWLKWSLVGLIPAGLGTLIFAPLAFFSAVKHLGGSNDKSEKRRAWMVIWLSMLAWLVSAGIFTLFILHIA